MKRRNASTLIQAGFTLTELLVVMAIIVALAGLLFPVISIAKRKAKEAKARTEEQMIVNAIKAYLTEYGKLPVDDADQGISNDKFYSNGSPSSSTPPAGYVTNIFNVLRAYAAGSNTNDVLNVKKMPFLDVPSKSLDENGYFLDPWGHPYFVKLDNDYNNVMEYYTAPATNIQAVAIVVSLGAVKNDTNNFWSSGAQCDPKSPDCDDIVSFR